MNILPHKSWHVRTKKNIARVRKDEAEAAEKEKEVQRRIQLAAQESRTAFLRDRAGQRVIDTGEELPIPLAQVADLTQSDGHINFFQEIEDGKKQDTGVNLDHEAEKKKEQDDYEKKIGLLVYLGQNSIEESKNRPWYENLDRHSKATITIKSNTSASSSSTLSPADKAAAEAKEVKLNKLRDFEDPLKDIRKYISGPGTSKNSAASSSSASSKAIPVPNSNAAKLKRRSDSVTNPSVKHKKSKKDKKKKSKSKKHKSKKRKHHQSSESESAGSGPDSEEERKQKNLEKLRTERLAREREERRKADKLLANLRGETLPEPKQPDQRIEYEGEARNRNTTASTYTEPRVKQKYNSQFNPELARQNYENH